MAVETRLVLGVYEALRALELWLEECTLEERDDVVKSHFRTVAMKVAEIRERVLQLLLLLEEQNFPRDV